MSATDSLIMSNALASPNIDLPFVSKRIVQINDLNTGNYSSGELKFETTGLASVNSYSDYANAVLSIPLVIGVYSAAIDYEAQKTDLMLSLKNSNLCLIDRLTVVSDGTTIINQTANINQLLCYELHQKISALDAKIWGDTIGYAEDTPNSWSYENAESSRGIGLSNCVNVPHETPSASRDAGQGFYNKGMFFRSAKFYKDIANGPRSFLSDKKCSDLAQDYVRNDVTGYKFYHITAFIRLKDLPFFDKLPLTKSMLLSITINLNAPCNFRIAKTAAGLYGVPSNTSFTGASNPIMFASSWVKAPVNVTESANDAAAYADTTYAAVAATTSPHIFQSGGSACVPVSTNIDIAMGVCSVTINAQKESHKLTTCQLLIPTYILDAQVERSYLSLGKKKHIFWDVASSVFQVPANSSFSQYLGSKPRLQKIVIVPQLTSTDNKNIDPMRSPYYSAPTTPSPMLASLISNFNCEIGGVFAYPQATKYSYESFLNELGYDCLNGNVSDGLGSGVISKQAFENEYGYLVIRVRKDAVNANSDLAVRIQGDSLCKLGMNLYCYLVYEKSCMVNLITGVLEDIVA